MKAVILAGGKGSRLEPYTKILPKPLLPIGDRPILEIFLHQLGRAGITEIIVSAGYLASLLRAFFEDGSRYGMKIRVSYEDEPLGTAGPLSLIDGLDETFLVANGDVLTTMNLTRLIDFHLKNRAIATVATHVHHMNIDLGVVQLNSSHEIIGYIEKPTYEFLVSMGIYVLEPQVLNYIKYNQYMDFPELVLNLINDRARVLAYPFDGYWRDLGRLSDYEQAVQDFEHIQEQILGEGTKGLD